VEVNGGVPAHIDESFDKCNQHLRISNPYKFRVKSSSFIMYCCCGKQGPNEGHKRRRC
jgi:hypothetical protein